MKILITGSKGFIGKNLLDFLRGNEILEINEDIFNTNDWIRELNEKLNSNKPEVIFHVGACSDTLELDANYMMIRNYEFTRRLCNWCKLVGSKMIYSSSAANYGTNNQYPSNLYGWSKYAGEDYVINSGGIALRYFNVYGPNEAQKGRMSSVAYQMLDKHKKGLEIKIFPKEPKRDFVYVKDIISANLYAMKNYESLHSNWYEVGSGFARTFEDVLNVLKVPFTYTDESEIPNGYQFYTKSEPNKWMPGWQSEWNLENGLMDYMEFLR